MPPTPRNAEPLAAAGIGVAEAPDDAATGHLGAWAVENARLLPAGAEALAATEAGAIAAVDLAVRWRSAAACHEDHLVAALDLNAAGLPAILAPLVRDAATGDRLPLGPATGTFVPAEDPALRLRLPARAFNPRRSGIHARTGRFYPRRFIAGHGGIAAGDRRPFRVTEAGDPMTVDLNHPLGGHAPDLSARPLAAWRPPDGAGDAVDAGGAVTGLLDRGPGLQARWRDRPTDFWADAPFRREAAGPDAEFYREPRLVNHLDTAALAQVAGLYARLLPKNGRILDLMSSWVSHLDPALAPASVTGLGMNAAELDANPLLAARVVHDLNAEPALPFPDQRFDAVVCTVSVEYLTRPFEVFAEAARVLRPGGRFVVTFSDRWFPPKVVRIWTELHDFERMGLVLEYFLAAERFSALATWSLRGLPRPADDPYAARLSHSDPVFAVWGERA